MDEHKHELSEVEAAAVDPQENSSSPSPMIPLENPSSPPSPMTPLENPPIFIFSAAPIDRASSKTSIHVDNISTGFRFQVKPAKRLKLAMEALCDPKFNPAGTGRIDVDNKGFGITVGKPSDVHAHLWLKASTLGDFQCSNPVVGELVDLTLITHNLDVQDTHTVTVSHIHGSSQITFTFGEEPTRMFSAKLLGKTAEIPEFQYVTIFCEAAIPSNDVDVMIEHLFVGEKPQIVSVDITAKRVTIFVGREKLLALGYDYKKMGFDGTRGMDEAGEQKHHAWFYWKYPEMLQKAARLYYAFLISFATIPPDNVMLRFTLQELGDLMFLTEASKIMPNFDADIEAVIKNPSALLQLTKGASSSTSP